MKACILNSFDACCDWSKPKQSRRETWWWNNEVDFAIKEKRKLWKIWKKGGSKELYLAASAEQSMQFIQQRKRHLKLGFLTSMKKTNYTDIMGEKYIRNDDGRIANKENEKLDIWKNYFKTLLNAEFPWDESSLPSIDPVLGPSIQITNEMVQTSINHLKSGKAAGPSGIVVEMLKAASNSIVPHISTLLIKSFNATKFRMTGTGLTLSISTKIKVMHWIVVTIEV